MGRSPHGERGLKYPSVTQHNARPGRSPHGERGLKYTSPMSNCCFDMSLPTRGAWIEIHRRPVFSAPSASLPTRGAWIEMSRSPRWSAPPWSLPTRGAWIEITPDCGILEAAEGRSPHGERGLKSGAGVLVHQHLQSLPTRGAWIEMSSAGSTSSPRMVAPHTGSVD